MAQATYVYRHRSYDWDDAAARHVDARRLSTAALILLLLRYQVDVLEVNEPLMRPGVFRAAAACVSVSASDALRRRRTRVVTYAIDNRDPFASDPAVGARSRLRKVLDRYAARVVWRRIDRVAYGTPIAQQTYRRALPPSRGSTKSKEILHLPVACECLRGTEIQGDDIGRVGFVGALSERKGLAQLLAAWPLVREKRPDAALSILGKGALEAALQTVAERDHSIDVTIDPPRALIHEVLRHARVLVLFSQPHPRWREQVGLPIVEALAHGCTVVVSDETGLAPWLAANGHHVLPADAWPERLAEAIATACAATDPTRARRAILASLPSVDGRAAAQEWLCAACADHA